MSYPAAWWARVKNDTAVTRNDALTKLFKTGSKVIEAFEIHSYNVTVFDFHSSTHVHDRQAKMTKKWTIWSLDSLLICHLPNATAACNAYARVLNCQLVKMVEPQYPEGGVI